jgi:hypothetical protein
MLSRWLTTPVYIVHVYLLSGGKSAKDSRQSTDRSKVKNQHPYNLFAHGQPNCRVLIEGIGNGENTLESHDLESHAWNQADGEQCSRHMTTVNYLNDSDE